LVQAKIAGKNIFDVIDREPLIKDHDQCQTKFDIVNEIRFE